LYIRGQRLVGLSNIFVFDDGELKRHLFNVGWLYRTMRELVCARSVTARIFTAREGAEQHCQVGNSALARDEVVRWLARFYPDMAAMSS
jgi:hypothetical protein